MEKYNFYCKNDLKEYFKPVSDADLRMKILNHMDSIKNSNEALEFVRSVKCTGVDVVNGLKDDTPYNEIKRNIELSYDEAKKRMNEFNRNLSKEEEFESSLSTYERDLYLKNKEDFEHSRLINEMMDLEESERGRTVKTHNYEDKAKELSERIDKYANWQQEKLRRNREARKRSGQGSNVSLQDIINNL